MRGRRGRFNGLLLLGSGRRAARRNAGAGFRGGLQRAEYIRFGFPSCGDPLHGIALLQPALSGKDGKDFFKARLGPVDKRFHLTPCVGAAFGGAKLRSEPLKPLKAVQRVGLRARLCKPCGDALQLL